MADWNERLKPICESYKECNVFNADESGLFFRILPNKTICLKKQECVGVKTSKEQLTLLLCCNMLGEFETPFKISKSLKPRCFNNIDINKLGVMWRANNNIWMTCSLMIKWLTAFDAILNKFYFWKMIKAHRKVHLFLDNATSHPTDLKLENVKVVFFLPNTTSVCQPLDQECTNCGPQTACSPLLICWWPASPCVILTSHLINEIFVVLNNEFSNVFLM